jgi:hypothetical protein
MSSLPPETRIRYQQLQQDADFALVKAREANAALKQAYARHLAGQGSLPGAKELEALAAIEEDATIKYRALREFLREAFGVN